MAEFLENSSTRSLTPLLDSMCGRTRRMATSDATERTVFAWAMMGLKTELSSTKEPREFSREWLEGG